MTQRRKLPITRHRLLAGIASASLLVVAACGSGSKSTSSTTKAPSTPASTSSTTVPVASMDDLAATPPMGWNSWNQVRCYDLNEDVVKSAADAIVRHGLDKLGYSYVVVDDCWQEPERAEDGSLQPNKERFPSGLKSLADYVHDKGLKFGLYLSPGSETCAMQWDEYPGTGLGSFGHERQDAEMLRDIGVDYLKYDWCAADETDGLVPQEAFAHMRDELERLERPIVYSISEYGKHQPWTWAPGIAHMWRTTSDIAPSWGSISHIINSQAEHYKYSGPGAWNDPDMLQVGNGELTDDEVRAHIGMWAMLAAPLMIGTDLDKVSPSILEALSNPDVIAVDQDPLGQQARRVSLDNGSQVWVRELEGGDLAVALLNSTDAETQIATTLEELDAESGPWNIRDLWTQSDAEPVGAETTEPSDSVISRKVPPHAMVMLRLSR